MKTETTIFGNLDLTKLDKAHKIAFIINKEIDKTKLFLRSHLVKELKGKGAPSAQYAVSIMEEIGTIKKSGEFVTVNYTMYDLYRFANIEKPVLYTVFTGRLKSTSKQKNIQLRQTPTELKWTRLSDYDILVTAKKMYYFILNYLENYKQEFYKEQFIYDLEKTDCPYKHLIWPYFKKNGFLLPVNLEKGFSKNSKVKIDLLKLNQADFTLFFPELLLEIEKNTIQKQKTRAKANKIHEDETINQSKIKKALEKNTLIINKIENIKSENQIPVIETLTADDLIEKLLSMYNNRDELARELIHKIRGQFEITCSSEYEKMRRIMFSWVNGDSDLAEELRDRGYTVAATKQISL